MGLCCAIMATLLQRWGRRYIWITQPSRCSPEKRARIRGSFAGSTDKLFVTVVCALLPCFLFNSELRDLPERIKRKFKRALVGFLDRTFSSNIVSESTRNIQVVTCLNAAHATHDSLAVSRLFQGILKGRWREALKSVKIGQSLRRWSHDDDQEIALYARSMVARIIANVREYDASAMALAVDQLGLSEHILQDHLAHGNSVLLANLIHITNQIFHSGSTCFDSDLLESLSKFDIQGTLPGLRRAFCALWNQIVMEAQDGGSQIAVLILKSLRRVYIALALHQGTEALPMAFSSSSDAQDHILGQPSSYPSCHCLDPPPHRLNNESKEAIQAHGSSHTSPPPDPASTTVTPSAVPWIPVHTTDRCPPGKN